MSDNCKVPQVKPIVIKRFGTSGLVPTIPTTTDCNLWQKTDLKDGEFAVNTQDNKLYIRSGNQILELTSGGGGGSGSVTSVGLSMPVAFNVSNSPITSAGLINVTGAGVVSQYIRGDGSLANFPNVIGGGSSVNYYFNGGISQGTISGNDYYEISRTPNIGPAVNFSLSSVNPDVFFITDVNDPGLLNIPNGNWNFQLYISMSSAGGAPEINAELFTYDGVNFTSIATSTPGLITGGTNTDFYIFSVPVPNTTIAITDRIAVKVTASSLGGRTATLYTQDTRVSQIITSFSNGLTALNGLIEQVQYFNTGTSGTDFNIASATDTHTFNLPTASATNRGALSSADWTTFNNKLSSAITSLNGLIGASQTFTNDTNVTISSAGTAHSLGWLGNLAVSRGGTGAGSFTANNVLLGNGTSAFQTVAPGTAGNVLTSNGTTWESAAPSGGGISGLTANRFVYATGATTIATDNDAYFDGTQIAFGTSSPITGTRTTILGSGTTSSTFGLQVHNSTGTNNALVVRDDNTVGIGTALPLAQLHINGAFPSKIGLIINGTNLTANNGSSAYWQNNGVDRGLIYVADSGSDALRGIKISNPTADSDIMVAAGNRGITISNQGSFTNTLAYATAVTNLLGSSTPLTIFGRDGSTTGSFINHVQNTNTVGRQTYVLHRALTSTNAIVNYGGFGTELMINTNAAHSGDLFWSTALTGTFAERMRLKASGSLLLGTNTEAASSILTLESTTKGILIPRMTTTDRGNITSPATGLLIYNTTTNEFNYYNGTAWRKLNDSPG